MIKVFVFVRRAPKVSADEFAEVFGIATADDLPGQRREIRCLPDPQRDQAAFPYDGIFELWFDDLEAWHTAAGALPGGLAEDLGNVFDPAQTVSFVAEEFPVM